MSRTQVPLSIALALPVLILAVGLTIFLTGVVRGAPGAAPHEQMPAGVSSDGIGPVEPLFTLIPELPRIMNFQGELVAKSSGIAPTGKYNMRFAMYDAATAGTKSWPSAAANEEHVQVDVADGLFNVLLGSQNQPLSYINFLVSFENLLKEPHLQIWVCKTAAQDPCTDYDEMSPRQPLASVGYSFVSEYAINAGVAGIASSLASGVTVDGSSTVAFKAATTDDNGAGLWGEARGTQANATGVFGLASSTTGAAHGVWGQAKGSGDFASGVYGQAQATNGKTIGVHGVTSSATQGAAGVLGTATSGEGAGVKGISESDSFGSVGVLGETSSISDLSAGVRGLAANGMGGEFIGHTGVKGRSSAAGGNGVQGVVTGENAGAAVRGDHQSTTAGSGVLGITDSSLNGAAGVTGAAISAAPADSSVEGRIYGVHGSTNSMAASAAGVFGEATFSGDAVGVMGAQGDGKYGVYSDGDAHVEGNLTWKAMTGYLSIPGSAFVPNGLGIQSYETDVTGGLTHLGFWVIAAGGETFSRDTDPGKYFAPVNLPQGAKVTKVVAYWEDYNSGNAQINLYNRELTASGSGTNMVGLSTSGTSGTFSSSQTTSISEPTIDNSTHIYTLAFDSPASETGAPPKPINFYGVVIEYTYTGP